MGALAVASFGVPAWAKSPESSPRPSLSPSFPPIPPGCLAQAAGAADGSALTTCPPKTPTPSPSPLPTSPTPAGYACAVTYTVHEWRGGFTADLKIGNTGSRPFTPWILQIVFSGDQQVTNAWGGGGWSQTPPSLQITNPTWNTSVDPGEQVGAIGFNATYSGANSPPAAVTLNGVPCDVTYVVQLPA